MSQSQKSKSSSDHLFSKIPDSQLEQFRKKNTIRIAIIGDKAYWVYDNTFYETDVVDGEIDREASRPIDTNKLSIKQVRMLMDVLDSIS
jgi:hypothetical protein